jgi:hypothetical protein
MHLPCDGANLAAWGFLNPRTSSALLPTGWATAMRAVPAEASTSISIRLHSRGSYEVFFTIVNSSRRCCSAGTVIPVSAIGCLELNAAERVERDLVG